MSRNRRLQRRGARGCTVLSQRRLAVEPLEDRRLLATLGAPSAHIDLLSTQAAGAITGMGVAGDSMSDEYDDAQSGADYPYAENWVQLLAANRGINFGPHEITDVEPRLDGYAYNWARWGATTTTLLEDGQHTGLAQQIQDDLVTHAVIAIGQNDFAPGSDAYTGIYYDLPDWTPQDIADYADTVVGNIDEAIQTIKVNGVQLVVSDIVDYGVTPLTQEWYPDANVRDRVTTVIDGINTRIIQLAQSYGVPAVDLNGLARQFLGTNQAPVPSQILGGVTITNDGGTGATHAFVADGIHPHTVVQAPMANMFLEAFNEGYGTNITLFTEQEMVEMAGLTYGGTDTLKWDFSDFVVLPPSLSINDVSVVEPSSGTADAVFTVTLSAASTVPVTVDYVTVDGTAIAGEDYEFQSDTLTFDPGVTQQTITVVITPDAPEMGSQQFTVELSNPTNAPILDSSGTGTIIHSPTTTVLSEQFMTAPFTAAGTCAAEGHTFPMTLKGTIAYDSPTEGTLSATGTGKLSVYKVTTTVNGTEDNGNIDGTVKVVSKPHYPNAEGTFPIEPGSTFDTSDFSASIYFGNSWSGTIKPTTAGVFDVVPNLATRVSDSEMDFTFKVDGPPTKTDDRGTPLTDLRVCWATGPTLSNKLGDFFSDPTPVFWNQAGGKIAVQGIDTPPEGATFLLLVADFGNTIDEGTKGEANNVLAVGLDRPTVSIANSVTIAEGKARSTTKGTVAVSLSAALLTADQPVTVHYEAIAGSALAGSDFKAASGDLTFKPGGATTQNIPLSVLGDGIYEGNETFLVKLSNASAGSRIVQDTATVSITDHEAKPTVSIAKTSIAKPPCREGSSGTTANSAVFKVSLSGPSSKDTIVTYSTLDGTAVAIVADVGDYVATTDGTVTILAGKTQQTIGVPVLGDQISEYNETFQVHLTEADIATVSPTANIATGTIIDDDALPTAEISATASVTEGPDAAAVFTVTLSQPSERTIQVYYSTTNGTAKAGTDFQGTTRTTAPIVFDKLVKSQIISVPIVNDNVNEAIETFKVSLTKATNASLVHNKSGVATITDDDPLPRVSAPKASSALGAATPRDTIADSTSALLADLAAAARPKARRALGPIVDQAILRFS